MPDEATPAPDEVQDTPQEVPAQQDTPDEVVNYRERYESLRPEFDRKSQAYAEAQSILQDPEKLAAYWQEQGYGADEEDDDTFQEEAVDSHTYQELQQLRQETAALKEWRAQQEQAASQQSEIAFIDEQLASVENEHGEISDKAAEWIGNRSLVQRDEQGRPDVAKAFEEFRSILEEDRQKYVKTKKVPSRPGSGAAAVEQVDKTTRKGRVNLLTQRMDELEA